jgi:hypothetical protein
LSSSLPTSITKTASLSSGDDDFDDWDQGFVWLLVPSHIFLSFFLLI